MRLVQDVARKDREKIQLERDHEQTRKTMLLEKSVLEDNVANLRAELTAAKAKADKVGYLERANQELSSQVCFLWVCVWGGGVSSVKRTAH